MEKRPRRSRLRLALRIIIPAVMIGLGALTIAHEGMRGAIALIPILAAHVVVASTIYLVVRYRRRRQVAKQIDTD